MHDFVELYVILSYCSLITAFVVVLYMIMPAGMHISIACVSLHVLVSYNPMMWWRQKQN